MIIPSETLNPILLEAFTGQTTWLEASTRCPPDDFIDTFFHTRQAMHRTIADITNKSSYAGGH